MLARLQVVIDERRRTDAPDLHLYVLWFDVDTTSVWRQYVRQSQGRRMAFVFDAVAASVNDLQAEGM